MLVIIFIAIGGALGSVSRYLVGGWAYNLTGNPTFPIGTLAVNLIGCFLIGLLSGLGEANKFLTPQMRALLIVGFLGGFTTFSSFGNETLVLLRNGQMLSALLNVGVQVVVGLLAVAGGYVIARAF
ncbi:MAG: fluoride efflux transporter CrcB [Dehalococcoidia bacterium]|nr:fluoride efflux transporter CrcB [Dehalococcoidia bacterium]